MLTVEYGSETIYYFATIACKLLIIIPCLSFLTKFIILILTTCWWLMEDCSENMNITYFRNHLLKLLCGDDFYFWAYFLILTGADVNDTKTSKITCLRRACNNGHLDIIMLLIKYGANVNAVDSHGHSYLHWACLDNKLHIVKYLIDSGANINAMNSLGQTCIYWACILNNFELVDLLIREGADVNVVDKKGYNCLYWTCVKKENMPKLLNECGADAVSLSGQDGTMHFILNQHGDQDFTNIAKLLISRGANTASNSTQFFNIIPCLSRRGSLLKYYKWHHRRNYILFLVFYGFLW